ncbi:MAG: DegV family protein [Oscillospiraceae bacterium]|nr:DegV family protein [Oscillospiraceae bacterium]
MSNIGNQKKIWLITDSGCDIPEGWEQKYNIDIMPFSIMIDDKEYWERVELKPELFYELARNSPGIPKTNQITVSRFEEKFLECLGEGVTDVIFVSINSAGSKTHENAVLARKNLTESGRLGGMKVHIIDSHCYSIGYGYPIVEASKKINAGQSAESVAAYLEDWFSCVEIYLLAFDLRHARKSGRITAAAGFLGEMMGIKPIISMIDEKTTIVKKSRGEKPAIDEAVALALERRIPETPYCIVRSTCTELEEYAISEMTKKSGMPPVMETVCGAAVASNAGVKFMGLIIRGQPRR